MILYAVAIRNSNNDYSRQFSLLQVFFTSFQSRFFKLPQVNFCCVDIRNTEHRFTSRDFCVRDYYRAGMDSIPALFQLPVLRSLFPSAPAGKEIRGLLPDTIASLCQLRQPVIRETGSASSFRPQTESLPLRARRHCRLPSHPGKLRRS